MIQQQPVVGGGGGVNNKHVKRERRRSKKMFETEEQERQAFLASETTLGVISALLLTISFAELLLSSSSYDTANTDPTLLTVARYFHVILSTLAASFSAAALTLTFHRSLFLSEAPIAATDEIIDTYLGANKGYLTGSVNQCVGFFVTPFHTMRFAYFCLLASIPFGVYLLHGFPMFIATFTIILFNIVFGEIVLAANRKRALKIVTEGLYA